MKSLIASSTWLLVFRRCRPAARRSTSQPIAPHRPGPPIVHFFGFELAVLVLAIRADREMEKSRPSRCSMR